MCVHSIYIVQFDEFSLEKSQPNYGICVKSSCSDRSVCPPPPPSNGIRSQPALNRKQNQLKLRIWCCVCLSAVYLCVAIGCEAAAYTYNFSLRWWQNIRKSFSFCLFVRTASEKKNKLTIAFDRNYAFHLALNLVWCEILVFEAKKSKLLLHRCEHFWLGATRFGCFGFLVASELVCVCVSVALSGSTWSEQGKRVATHTKKKKHWAGFRALPFWL